VFKASCVDYTQDNNDYYFLNIEQDTAGGSVTGHLAWDLFGAGVPAISFGANIAKRRLWPPPASRTTFSWAAALPAVRGEFNVEEGFCRTRSAADQEWNRQELSQLAGRYTSYSLSGAVRLGKWVSPARSMTISVFDHLVL